MIKQLFLLISLVVLGFGKLSAQNCNTFLLYYPYMYSSSTEEQKISGWYSGQLVIENGDELNGFVLVSKHEVQYTQSFPPKETETYSVDSIKSVTVKGCLNIINGLDQTTFRVFDEKFYRLLNDGEIEIYDTDLNCLNLKPDEYGSLYVRSKNAEELDNASKFFDISSRRHINRILTKYFEIPFNPKQFEDGDAAFKKLIKLNTGEGSARR
ncbi:hypothetical protein [Salibacter halophilus]|uniref:Uncharacterized protein n=1 Tax=Salibacter halophilus TaxID=1803916 RepID=A0A6N6M9M7_9FLAO|nr:hypothetical protein [Salibacter halophilus]KAB1063766.1 hypothetical protein F3059_09365 [Salibacter halophilus]